MLFRWGPKVPPFFPQRGHDFEIRFSDLNLLSLSCAFSHNNSYGLAHMQFGARQKYLKNQLNFNNFALEHVVRNKIVIFAPRFSLILDMVFFMLQFRDPIFDQNLGVPILSCFTNGFQQFCFGCCFVVLAFCRFPTHVALSRRCVRRLLSQN